MAESAASNLEHWRARLNASGLPVFARTVRDISHVASSKASSAGDLSNVIGQDAAMAVRILQIANSSLFNLQGRSISTISEAVVLVGFNAVRELAISVSVIEELLKGDQHGQLGQIMAHAFHAAAQAKFLAEHQELAGTEEVFVAALLKQVGEMAFWARAERDAQLLEQQLHNGVDPAQAQCNVLGFEFSELSRLLAEDWSLGDLVMAVLEGHQSSVPTVASVNQGHDVAQVLETCAWESEEVSRLVTEVAEQLGMPAEDVRQALHDNLADATEMIEHFGIPPIQVPQPGPTEVTTPAPSHVMQADMADTARTPVPVDLGQVPGAYNATSLLLALQEIATALEEGCSRDELMSQIVAGAGNTLGLENVYFALFSPDRQRLFVKYVTATQGGAAAGEEISLQDLPVDVLAPEASRVSTYNGNRLIVSVRLSNKPVGVFFGSVPNGQIPDAEQVMGFRQFSQQLGLALSRQ